MGLLRRAAGLDDSLAIAQRLARSFRAVALLVAITGVVAIASFAIELAVYRPQLDRDIDARSGARVAHQGMLDQQASVRGYLLTGDRDLLDGYRKGETEVAAGEAQVDATIGHNAQFSPLIADVRRTEQAWMQQWARPVAAAATPPAGAATAVGNRDAQLFAAYQSVDDRLVAAILDQYNAAHRDEGVALGVSAAIRLAIIVALLAFIAVEQRRLRRALVRPFSALLATMRRVRDGDLAVQAVVEGPAEVRQVAVGFNEMTRALAEERSMRASRETEVMYNASKLQELLETARNLAGSLNLRYVLDAVATHAQSLSGCDVATVWLVDGEQGGLTAGRAATVAGSGSSDRQPIDLGSGAVGQAARGGRVVSAGGGPGDAPEMASVTAVPMVVGARVVGVIELASRRGPGMPQQVQALVETLASHAGTAVEAARLHARTEELSQVDALTKLFNRRRLEADLDRECKRSRRYDRPLAFCMMDVDHFKQFNDRYGHRRGDAVLEEVGALLRDGIRSSDSAYRYGGEEFGMLLRDTSLSAAAALCERLRRRIAGHFTEGSITASFGIAALEPSMDSPSDLIETADRALYRAKRDGRDRVVVSAGGVLNGDSRATPGDTPPRPAPPG